MTDLFIPGKEHPITLEGHVGTLEALTVTPTELHTDTLAILCHPHSLHGGSMHNKVITTVARAFRDCGIRSVRMNMRGVGASAGEYDAGIGESDDVLKILEQLQAYTGEVPIILAGFSFGSYVAYRTAQYITPQKLLTIAPGVERYDFSAPYPTVPWLVYMPDADEVVSPQAVYEWHKTLDPAPELHRFPEASHFFHGRLLALKQMLIEHFSV